LHKPHETTDKTYKSIEQIVRLFRSAKESLIKELTRVDVSAYKEIDAIQASGRITAILNVLKDKMFSWSAKSLKTSYDESAGKARVSLEILGRTTRPFWNPQKHNQTLQEYYSLMTSDFQRAISTIRRTADTVLNMSRQASSIIQRFQAWDFRDIEDYGNFLEDMSTEAVEKGWSRVKLIKSIKEYHIKMLEDGDFIEVNGRHYSLDYYAEMVGRTRLREAQTDATKNLCDEYENDLVEWSYHVNPCNDCADKEGNIYSISGTHPVYPVLTSDDEPPLHPNCEHSISPTSDIAIAYRHKYA
jgi:hypothetical protein